MCFSATASFSSAALLLSIGVGTTYLNRTPSHRMFAFTPILFGIQQLSEGFIWLSVKQNVPNYFTQQLCVTTFMFIALAIWPTWIPWAVWNLEFNKKRRLILQGFLTAGIFASTLAIIALVIGTTHVRVVGHSLDYPIRNPFDFLTPNFGSILYTSTTVGPFFVSSNRIVKTMGFLIVVALILTLIINKHAVTSVWCFFSALVSFYIAAIVVVRERKFV